MATFRVIINKTIAVLIAVASNSKKKLNSRKTHLTIKSFEVQFRALTDATLKSQDNLCENWWMIADGHLRWSIKKRVVAQTVKWQ